MSVTSNRLWGNLWRQLRGIYVIFVVLLYCGRYCYCGLAAIPVSGRPVSQSSVMAPRLYFVEQTVDGNSETFSHTDVDDTHPWWRLDLTTRLCLGRITVILRPRCCGFRFIAAVARAGFNVDHTENVPCGSPATKAQSQEGAVIEFLCDPPRMARYVSLDINSSSPGVQQAVLQIAEVMVGQYTCGECAIKDDLGPTLESINFERSKKGAFITGPNPISAEVAKSPPLCAVYCMVNTICLSFAFSAANGQCSLYSLSSAEIEVTASDDFSVYVMTE